ncbi:MAG: OmpA family protein [bacterium]|nr:OmpA family protein [bacterium]
MSARVLAKAFAVLLWTLPVWPQTPVHHLEQRPVYKVDVVEKVTLAVNYRHRSGATRIAFKGSPLMPRAAGEAKVESKRGYIEIDAGFRNLQPAITFGAEYLTYVMWAITPEGRAANLGEVLVKNARSKLNVTTELQVFGLVVTAEPYFAVRRPSDLVVLENEVRQDTKGKVVVIDAKYELLKRGEYQRLSNPLMLTVDPKIPLELYEARNAVQIARASGASEHANETFLKSERSLRQAEAYQSRNAGWKPVSMLAREAVQHAEDAREIAIRRQEQQRLARERKEAAEREAAARKAAEEEARRRAEAEARRKKEAEQRAALERRAEQQAEEAAQARDQFERDRKRLELELADAKQNADRAKAQLEDTLALLAERSAGFQQEKTRWDEERERREAEEAERSRRLSELQKAELRMRIFSQLNRVMVARQTTAGVTLDLKDVLFEPEGAELSPAGRETLALIAGIMLAHPGLMFSLKTPSVAALGEEFQEPIEQRRAATVATYLETRAVQKIPPNVRLREKSPPLPAAEADTPEPSAFPQLVIVGEPIGLSVEPAVEDKSARF